MHAHVPARRVPFPFRELIDAAKRVFAAVGAGPTSTQPSQLIENLYYVIMSYVDKRGINNWSLGYQIQQITIFFPVFFPLTKKKIKARRNS